MKLFRYLAMVVILYILIPYILILFPKKGLQSAIKDRRIYLYYDSLHTNIIVDIREEPSRWVELFPELLRGREFGYLEFGLGDRETYINTKYWSNLKLRTLLKALFTETDSVIHVSHYSNIDISKLKTLHVDRLQYGVLIESILKSFGDIPKFIAKGYYRNDAFYSAVYSYSLLFTCNTWIDTLLKEANVTVVRWTPFSYPIIISIPKS